jgi:lipoprotein-anchoring transpeptidase ErfK/SrfK
MSYPERSDKICVVFGELAMGSCMREGSRLWLAVAVAAVLCGFLPPGGIAASAREVVAAAGGYGAGTIVIRTSERRLYYYVDSGHAIRYPVGVGRAGQQWSGSSVIDAKYVSPDWAPPPEIRRENPKLPPLIPGGSPHNPMGVAAMTLSGLDYAIHGTNQPSSIGHFVSHGCIRMFNEDVSDLFARVGVGTPVVVQ